MVKPLLIDLSYGRVGTYQKTKKSSSSSERMDIYYTPFIGGGGGLSGVIKDKVIKDVPIGSLVGPIQPFDEEKCPSCPIVVLLAGEYGEAPLMNQHLGQEVNRILEASRRIKMQAEIREAVAERKTRMAESKEDVVLQDKIKSMKEVARVRPVYTKGGKPLSYWETEGEE